MGKIEVRGGNGFTIYEDRLDEMVRSAYDALKSGYGVFERMITPTAVSPQVLNVTLNRIVVYFYSIFKKCPLVICQFIA